MRENGLNFFIAVREGHDGTGHGDLFKKFNSFWGTGGISAKKKGGIFMADEIDFSNLTDMLGALLENDEGKSQIQNILSMFTAEPNQKSAPGVATGGINPDNLEMMLKIGQVMSAIGDCKTSKQTALLSALRDLLRPERRGSVDNAVKFLSVGKAIDALRKIEGV